MGLGYGQTGQNAATGTVGSSAAPGQAQRLSKDRLMLNFANAELEAVVRTVGELVGKTFIVDPRIKGNLTLQNDSPLTREQAYQQLLTQLRLAGYAAVQTGRVVRVVPESDGKTQGGSVLSNATHAKTEKSGDELLTQIFRLQYESAQNVLTVVRPLIAPNNVVTASAASNTLVVTDYAENLQRIAQIINQLDKPAAPQTELIALKNASAVDLASLLQKLQEAGAQSAVPGQTVERNTILAELRSNSLVVRARSAAALEQIKQLIEKLDVQNARNNNVNIVHLKNADATKLAATLRAVLSGESTAASAPATGAGQAGGANAANASNSGLADRSNVQADATTNTLIITAPEPVYRNLRGIIEQLDVRRAQVYVESLIAEVTSEKAAEFGVQWLSGMSRAANSTGGNTAFSGTSFSASSGGVSIQAASSDPSALAGAGFVLGVANGVSSILGKNFLNLGFLAQALEKEAQANILSTPNVTTLDNEEAKVVIGENVPFITGSYSQAGAGGGGATTNPFQTIERKDVGLTLKVKPQVSESGAIKLTIYQEISSVKDKTLAAGIITSKRSLETNVLVESGQVVVIGGLIEDSYADSEERVPGLGSIPILGNLFKYQGRKRTKTNLMIFLRPIIISDGKGSSLLSQDRYDGIRDVQIQSQPVKKALLMEMSVPILPTFEQLQNNGLKPSLELSKPRLP